MAKLELLQADYNTLSRTVVPNEVSPIFIASLFFYQTVIIILNETRRISDGYAPVS